MALSEGIINNIKAAFKRSLRDSREYADSPYINVLRYTLTGGDPALGEDFTKIDNSLYFVEADVDQDMVTRRTLADGTSFATSSNNVFYVDCGPIDFTDKIEYYTEARIDGRAYGNVIKCYSGKFIGNDIQPDDKIKIYTSNDLITPGVSGYRYDGEYTIATVDSDYQVTLTTSIGVTGGETRAYTAGVPALYTVSHISSTPDFGYTVIYGIEQD